MSLDFGLNVTWIMDYLLYGLLELVLHYTVGSGCLRRYMAFRSFMKPSWVL